jgi:hypothetical protein
MILYHTSDREITAPDIRRGRKNADFGWGFYLTPDKEFTYRWARENAVVNEYEFDESGLVIRKFTRSLEWFDYIFNNRRLNDGIEADVIIGPIANDTIFDTLGIITSGFLKPEDALKILMIGPEYIQVAIKTQKAASNLKFLRSEKIERANQEEFSKEQDEYLRKFAEELEQMDLGG